MKKLFLFLFLAPALHAQLSTNAPRTYFEAYDAVTDAPLVKGMTTIATLNNQINYPVEIRVERLTNLQTSNTIAAVSLRTRLGSHQTLVDYIDYDELDGFIRGLQTISQADNNITPMDNFEVAYRTRCGLSVVKLNIKNKLAILLNSGNPGAVRNEMAAFVLDDLSRDLIAAKAKLDALAAGTTP